MVVVRGVLALSAGIWNNGHGLSGAGKAGCFPG